MAPTAVLVPAAVDALGQANSARVRALVGEFRRVLNKEDRVCTIIVTRARGGEVTAEDVDLLHALVGEEAVGRLRVRPVPARERYAPNHAVTNLLQQLAKSLTRRASLNAVLSISRSAQCSKALSSPLSGPAEQRYAVPFEHIKAPRRRDSGARQ